MGRLRIFTMRLAGIFRKRSLDRELEIELRSHIDALAEENIRRGMKPEEARHAARREFGGVEQTKELYRERRGLPFFETLFHDIRFGARMLAKNPGFTIVAVLALALGIGANTAIFSVVKAVLVRGLPFKDPAQLVRVNESVAKGGRSPVAYPNYLDWRAQNSVFEEMAAFGDCEMILDGKDKSDRLDCEQVSDTYFHLLGVSAVLGRTFTSEENAIPMKHAVALIGYGLWQRRFGSDPQVLGKPIRLNAYEYKIVGVLPKGFLGYSDLAEVWIPMMMRDAAWPQVAKYDYLHTRDIHFHKVLARLKPGVSIAMAQTQMETIAARLAKAYPKENRERGVLVTPATEDYVRSFRSPLLVLLGAVTFVLLIACANVTNLILTRSAARDRELAIRLALGAGRGRLIRQFLAESLLLTLGGALAGVALAFWGLDLLVSVLPVTFPSFTHVSLDSGVLFFAFALAAGTALLLTILPVLNSARADVNESLKESLKSSTSLRGRQTGRLLIASEVALALVLMIGAGLMLRSLGHLLADSLGFQPDHLATLRFYVPDRKYEGDGQNRFGPELAERIAQFPGVKSAAATFIDPFLWGGFQRGFIVEGHAPISNAEADTVYYQEVGPNYFHTMEIPLMQGRDFSTRDSLSTSGVVMVSESFARRYWPGQDAVGKRIRYGGADSTNPWLQVIGVAGNVKYNSLRQDPEAEPVIYGALLQSEVIINMSLVVRTHNSPEAMLGPLREEMQRIDPAIPVYNVATVSERMHKDSAETRSYGLLLALFAALALVLAAVGIYGVMSYWVTQRTREMGIRLSFGAKPSDLHRLVIGEGIRLALAGIAAGALGAVLVTRAMASLLYGVKPFDPVLFAVLAAGLTVVVILACYIPARRATKVDPMVALRYE
ncbi:MAG TPA: ABC transporter permease [Candidatus Acidoferrum sp.]|nr:ABC transporter permease [Candidatus Acidoferrum sp.]